MSTEREEACNLVDQALHILRGNPKDYKDDYYDAALWRLVDAAGIVSTNIQSRFRDNKPHITGQAGRPTGRGYFVGEDAHHFIC
jgi:hypothetical protein